MEKVSPRNFIINDAHLRAAYKLRCSACSLLTPLIYRFIKSRDNAAVSTVSIKYNDPTICEYRTIIFSLSGHKRVTKDCTTVPSEFEFIYPCKCYIGIIKQAPFILTE